MKDNDFLLIFITLALLVGSMEDISNIISNMNSLNPLPEQPGFHG
jgi:hypothetical protein